jgi:hypothetical protein
MRELDPFLGAYPFDHTLKRWLGLTSFITASTVARLQPITGRIASVTVHGDGKLDAPAMDTSQEEEEQGKWNERKEIKIKIKEGDWLKIIFLFLFLFFLFL